MPVLTDRERIWRAIRAAGRPVMPREVAAELADIDYDNLRRAICKMRAQGLLLMCGGSHQVRYVAVGRCPKDMRGRTEGSAMGRRLGNQASLERQRAAHGAKLKPRPGTLEAAWGWGV